MKNEAPTIWLTPIALYPRASLVRSVETAWAFRLCSKVGLENGQGNLSCPAGECGKEFELARVETRAFELLPPMFERGHFYRSELKQAEILAGVVG